MMYKLIACSVFKGMFKNDETLYKYMREVIQPLLGCTHFSRYAVQRVMHAEGIIFKAKETKGILFKAKERGAIWGGFLEDKEDKIRSGYVEVFITHNLKYKNIKGVQND